VLWRPIPPGYIQNIAKCIVLTLVSLSITIYKCCEDPYHLGTSTSDPINMHIRPDNPAHPCKDSSNTNKHTFYSSLQQMLPNGDKIQFFLYWDIQVLCFLLGQLFSHGCFLSCFCTSSLGALDGLLWDKELNLRFLSHGFLNYHIFF
jgi:hypothetical protein